MIVSEASERGSVEVSCAGEKWTTASARWPTRGKNPPHTRPCPSVFESNVLFVIAPAFELTAKHLKSNCYHRPWNSRLMSRKIIAGLAWKKKYARIRLKITGHLQSQVSTTTFYGHLKRIFQRYIIEVSSKSYAQY